MHLHLPLALCLLSTASASYFSSFYSPSTSANSTGRQIRYYDYSAQGDALGSLTVRSSSMKRFNGGPNTVNVLYYRGGGDAKKSRTPLIRSFMIYKSLLNEAALYESRQHDGASLTVMNARIPLTITNTSLQYFWASDFHPQAIEESSIDCFNHQDRRNTFCFVGNNDKCVANITDLPDLSLFSFYTKSGNRLTQFAWTCRQGQVCCEWECCDPEPSMWVMMGGLAAILLLFLVGCGVIHCFYALTEKCCNEQKREPLEKEVDPEVPVEREPEEPVQG